MAETHSNVSVSDSGPRVNPELPHISASPNGVICCDCCDLEACDVKVVLISN